MPPPPPAEGELSQSIEVESIEPRSPLWLILGRAIKLYLILFLALGLLMSLLGVNPLAQNGLMPKVLLLLVGASTLLALAGAHSNLLVEYGHMWLSLRPKHRRPQDK